MGEKKLGSTAAVHRGWFSGAPKTGPDEREASSQKKGGEGEEKRSRSQRGTVGQDYDPSFGQRLRRAAATPSERIDILPVDT